MHASIFLVQVCSQSLSFFFYKLSVNSYIPHLLTRFARRATKEVMDNNTKPNTETNEFKELKDLVWHACYREFAPSCYDEFKKDDNILSASKCLLEKSLDGISTMVAGECTVCDSICVIRV